MKTWFFLYLVIACLLRTIRLRLSLKRGFGRCGHGFGECDGLGGLGAFDGLGGFDEFSVFDGFSGLGRFVF